MRDLTISYTKVTDQLGRKVSVFNGEAQAIVEKQFPLHFREPPSRSDRQVHMIYCARAKPETDRKGIDKTRTLDKYLWACLRPKTVRPGGHDQPRRMFKRGGTEERTPLLDSNGADSNSNSNSWTSQTASREDSFVFEEVRRSVEGVLERHREKFMDILGERDSSPMRRSCGSAIHMQYAKAYLKHRTVDSDWEMARMCYGEIVGEDRDADGEEVLILDNPSPALLELVSDLGDDVAEKGDIHRSQNGRPGMGLVTLETVQETEWCCLSRTRSRAAYAAKPSLEFFFANTDVDPTSEPSDDFEEAFRQKLRQCIVDPTQDQHIPPAVRILVNLWFVKVTIRISLDSYGF